MYLKRNEELMHYYWPVKHAASTINVNSLLMPGVTADTDLGVLILATSACGDAVGILRQQLSSSTSDTLVAGTVWNTRQVEPITPMRVLEVEYDQADTAAVASTSTTTVTITSLEDNIDTSYLYAATGTGAYLLAYLASSASGSATSKTSTGWDSTTTVIKILRLFHQLAKINAAADKIGTDAAAGSWTCLIMNNYFKFNGDKQYLDPTKHDNKSFGASAKFFAEVCARNAGPQTVD